MRWLSLLRWSVAATAAAARAAAWLAEESQLSGEGVEGAVERRGGGNSQTSSGV